MKYIKLVRNLKASEYLRNILKLGVGSIVAQLVAIVAAPVFTRIYSPNELGRYSILASFIFIFVPIMNLRYDVLIVNAKDDKEADMISSASIILSLIIGVLITIISFGYNYYKFSSIFGKDILFFFTIPIIVLLGFINVLSAYNNRLKDYQVLSKDSVVRALFQNIVSIILGLLNIGTLGLICSQMFATILGLFIQFKSFFRKGRKIIFIGLKDFFEILRRYYKQPLFSTPAILMNVLSYSLINILIGSLFGLSELGYYSISYRMLGIPLALISTNVGKVYYEKACEEKKNNGNFSNSYNKTSLMLLFLSFFIFGFLFIFSEKIFSVVFGTDWVRAGKFVSILSPMFAIRFIVSALSSSMIIANRQKTELTMQIFFLVVLGSIYLYAKYIFIDITIFLKLISFSYFIIYLVIYCFQFKMSIENRKVKREGRNDN